MFLQGKKKEKTYLAHIGHDKVAKIQQVVVELVKEHANPVDGRFVLVEGVVAAAAASVCCSITTWVCAAAGGVYLLAPCNVRHAHHHRRPQQQLHLAIRFPERRQHNLRTAAVFWDLVTRVAGRNQGVSEIEHKRGEKKLSDLDRTGDKV